LQQELGKVWESSCCINTLHIRKTSSIAKIETASVCALQTLGIAFKNFGKEKQQKEDSAISILRSIRNSKNAHSPHTTKLEGLQDILRQES